MAIEHDVIADGERHEPKGIASATANTVYIADGVGSGSWEAHAPHGGWRYTNIGTGTTYTTPSTYTLLNVAGSSTHLYNFTFNSAGRLTYTGTPDRHVHMVVDMSLKHSTGSGQDIYFDVYKNGSTASGENVVTADSGNYQHIAMHWDGVVSTNDYLEIYLKTASGNVIIHEAYMFVMGMPA